MGLSSLLIFMYNFTDCNVTDSIFGKVHTCQITGVEFHECFNSWDNKSFIKFPKPCAEGEYYELLNGHYALRNANAAEKTVLNLFWDISGEDYRASLFHSMRANYDIIVDLLRNPAKVFAQQPNPEWVKVSDLQNLAKRLEDEFGATIHILGDKYIAEYKGQMWDLATGEGSFTVDQGRYDYKYFPKMSRNLGHRIPFLSLRQSCHLSRETVKSYLHRPATEMSKDEVAAWFSGWLGSSSWKSKYWMHHDIDTPEYRASVVANHAKDMIIVTKSDGVHIFAGKQHIVCKRLPKLFYAFAKHSLVLDKDYSVSGTGWALTW